MARKVSGLSHRPPIISSRPASIRLAIAISPSRDNSSTEPISRRYMRTGSSVRPRLSASTLPLGDSRSSASGFFSTSSSSWTASASSSSFSTTWMPISDSTAITSSICSDDIWSGGSTAFNSSKVM